MSSNSISAKEMARYLENNTPMRLLDVREPIEYHTYNIGGLNIPLSLLRNTLPIADWDKQDELIVICKVGLRSKTAQSILHENGYTNVRNLTGGLMALQKLK
ncbi:rhodanese-like domain-containing protein [Mucilaginibacter boryungensis]|nr:rhodanese-like domain-containing protein [Mucilaginibacter boryungensis]